MAKSLQPDKLTDFAQAHKDLDTTFKKRVDVEVARFEEGVALNTESSTPPPLLLILVCVCEWITVHSPEVDKSFYLEEEKYVSILYLISKHAHPGVNMNSI